MHPNSAGPCGVSSNASQKTSAYGQMSSPSPAPGHLLGGQLDKHLHHAANGLASVSRPGIPLGPLCHHYALAYMSDSDFFLQAILNEERDAKGKGKAKATSQSAQEYMRLHYLALALLRIAAAQPGMTIKEQARIALDLGRVALRIMRASEGQGSRVPLDSEQEVLVQDVSKRISKALASVQKSDLLAGLRRELNVLQAEFTVAQGDEKRAIKFIKACREVEKDRQDSAYQYTLTLLLARIYTSTSMSSVSLAMEELEVLMELSETRGDTRVTQLAALARLRLVFSSNLWSEVEGCLAACSRAMGFKEPANLPAAMQGRSRSASRGHSTEASPAPFLANATPGPVDSPDEDQMESELAIKDPWEVSVHIHFLCLQAAWESRIGETKRSKVYLDALFKYGDKLSEQPCASGVHTISLQDTNSEGVNKHLVVQLTPSGMLETMIYFAAGVSRRDTVGSKDNNKRLRCSILGLERLASSTGTWDMALHGHADLARVYAITRNLQNLKAGFLFELAITSLLRNAHEDASRTISDLIQHLRTHDLFPVYGLRLLLLQAQLAHSLNLTSRARQCYRACYSNANQNSDLELVARLNDMLLLYGTKRGSISVGLETALTALVEQCSTSNEMGIRVASMALGALTSDGVQATKKRLSRVLTYCNAAEFQVFRMVFFAISAPLYSHTQPLQSIKLLESALTISQHHGGSERESGVGLAALGMFVARELGILYAQTGRSSERIKSMQTTVQAHRRRFDELVQAGPELAGMSRVEEREPKRLKTSHDAV